VRRHTVAVTPLNPIATTKPRQIRKSKYKIVIN
jgi:hypothetical protein